MPRILLIVWLSLISINCYSQINYNFYYKPAKQELETEISYGSRYKIGLIHNEDKSYFRVLNNHCTYIYFQYSFYSIGIKFVAGYGTYYDLELSINYQIYRFEIDIGTSITEPFMIEFKFNLF